MTDYSEWEEEMPTEAGTFWFYGWTSSLDRRSNPETPKLKHVHVHNIRNGMMYIADGNFLYREEGALGVWMRSHLPHTPSPRSMTDLFSDICTCDEFRIKNHGCSCRPKTEGK